MGNIALIGFMGTGKTTVGLSVAEYLGWNFIDTDKEIEKRMGMAIPRIFHEYGEERFRLEERLVVQNVSRLQNHVIATGGGVVLNQENINLLRTSSLIVCLKAEASVILERVKKDQSRPLLAVENPLKMINKLLTMREPYYKCADIYIDTSHQEIEAIRGKILDYFNKRGIDNAGTAYC
ncbi:MAG: shikimate kinase [Bacillota bacterium]